jgi:ribonucleoside-diphosphate reductase alpha chain
MNPKVKAEAIEPAVSATPFQPTGLGLSIFDERYSQPKFVESWVDACKRVATTNSRAEQNGNAAKYQARFEQQLVSGKWMPGGRFWASSGKKVQQTMNCYVIPIEDTIEGWGKSWADVGTISARGGGVGINFSAVRPRGYPISGMGGTTTGSLSPMKVINAIGEEIKDGGGRRAALMFCLNINHPDVEEFLDAKIKVGDISNANISVMIPEDMDPEDFIKMVKNDEDMPLMFNGLADKLGRTIKAKKLWDWLVTNAWNNGEPGILNWFLVQKMNNLRYCKPLIAVNPCGEQALSGYSNCCLGHLVLPRFVKEGKLDWEELDESIRLAVRFLDNSIDVAHYPLPENTKVAQEERRIGLGVMGLHSMLLDLGMKYNSPEAHKFVDKLMGTIKNTAYDASINLAIEKGPFPLYDPKILEGGFVKTLKPGIRHKIKEHGLRNCCLLTVAPTGTTSMVQGVTGGIEPVFSPVYIRRRRVVDKMQNEALVETLVVSQEYVDHPDLVQGAYDLHPSDHLEMQRIVQKHIDAATSKTINLPKDFPVEDLSDLWLEYLPYLKGTTFYREGSRETADSFEPMKHVPADQMDSMIYSWKGEIEYELPDVMDCPDGSCEL